MAHPVSSKAAPRVASRLLRSFETELVESKDGHTIEALIVPYDTPTRVKDPPDFIPYEEVWVRGAFEKQVGARERLKIFLNFEHQQSLSGVVGHGVSLRDEGNGLHGTFRVHENADGDKALHLIREGLLTGLSLEAVPLSSNRKNGVVERVRAHLDRVSLVRFPAFKDAQVLAVRERGTS